MSSASWLVGYVTLPAATIVFDGDDVALAAGTYALRHGTAAISLIDYLNTTLDAAPSAVTCTSLIVMRNRYVQINLSGVAEIDWTTGGATAATWADALGFDGTDLTGAASYTADEVSPLLFSAGFMATPTTPQDTDGYTVPHQSAYKADDGTQIYSVRYGVETWQELSWSHILPERMMVADTSDQGGTFKSFWDNVAAHHRRFTYYQEIDEDDSSTTAVTWTTGRGPYALREVDPGWYKRNVQFAEVSNSLELPIMKLAEVT